MYYQCECGNETQFYFEDDFGYIGVVRNINSDDAGLPLSKFVYLYCHDCNEEGKPTDFQIK